jgi:pentatricopeptide repeat protein
MANSTTQTAKTITADNDATMIVKPSSDKQYRWRWNFTASVVSALTLALFLIDFVLLDTDSGIYASVFGAEVLQQAWTSLQPGKLFALDCLMGGSLLALVMFKFLATGGSKKKAAERKMQKRLPVPKGSRNHNRKQDVTRAQDGVDASRMSEHAANFRMVAERATVSKFNHAIDAATKQGDIQKAASILAEFEKQASPTTGRPDAVSYNLLIRACAKKGDFQGAVEWLSRMEGSGLEATICSYNTILDACAKSNKAEACESWLKTMLTKGMEPNVISYATAIYAWARRGEETRAKQWLQKMISTGVTPDAVRYNSMIHACGVSGNAAGAAQWMLEMQERGLEASVTTFTTVIDACAKRGDMERAEKVLEAMISANVEPNVVSFSAMIDACAKASSPTRAEFWHNRMVECGVKPNAHSYSAVINACAKGGDVAMAEEWLARAEKAQVADVVLYSSVIDACGKGGDPERAMCVFERMQEQGIQPHIVAYAALARPFAYKGDFKTVERIADEMKSKGVAPNEYFLYAQLLSYSTTRPRQGERAERCFREGLHMGLKPNDHVVGALARAVGRDRATELMAELCEGMPVPLPPSQRREAGGNKAKSAPWRQ